MSKRVLGPLYLQVLIAVAAGIAVGVFAPRLGSQLKPLGFKYPWIGLYVKLFVFVLCVVLLAAWASAIRTAIRGEEDGQGSSVR